MLRKLFGNAAASIGSSNQTFVSTGADIAVGEALGLAVETFTGNFDDAVGQGELLISRLNRALNILGNRGFAGDKGAQSNAEALGDVLKILEAANDFKKNHLSKFQGENFKGGLWIFVEDELSRDAGRLDLKIGAVIRGSKTPVIDLCNREGRSINTQNLGYVVGFMTDSKGNINPDIKWAKPSGPKNSWWKFQPSNVQAAKT